MLLSNVFKANFNPSQVRDERGRWSFSIGVGTLKDFLDRLSKSDGGFTYQPRTRREPSEGFLLSINPERSFAVDLDKLSPVDLIKYLRKNKDIWEQEDHYFGGWHDPKTHRIFLDVSVVKSDRREADMLARKHDQKAYFDLKLGKSVEVNAEATSGGVAKGDNDGERKRKADFAFTFGKVEFGLGGNSELLSGTDGEGTDSRGSEGGAGGVEPAELMVTDFGGAMQLVAKFEYQSPEIIHKFNPNHHPAGTPGGKGGQFAPGKGSGRAEGESMSDAARRVMESRPSGSVAINPDTGKPFLNPSLNWDTAEKMRSHGLMEKEEKPRMGKTAREIFGDGPDNTQQKYADPIYKLDANGNRVKDSKGNDVIEGWDYGRSPERVALHERIIDKFLSGYQGIDEKTGEEIYTTLKKENPPTAYFLAGGTASGKSTAVRSLGETNSVLVNPDEIKRFFDEYKGMLRTKDPYAAWGVHEESSDLAKEISARAQKLGLNILVDGTGDSNPGNVEGRRGFIGKIATAKLDFKYKTKAVLVDLPTNIAIERSWSRANGHSDGTPGDNRYVSVGSVRKMHSGAAARHKEWRDSDLVDSWEVWTNNVPAGEKSRIVATGGGGKKITVRDQTEYNRILAKADEKGD